MAGFPYKYNKHSGGFKDLDGLGDIHSKIRWNKAIIDWVMVEMNKNMGECKI